VTLLILRSCPRAAEVVNHVGRTPVEWARDRNRSREVISILELASRIDEYRADSQKALLEGRNDAAISSYTKLIEFDNTNAANYFQRSAAYLWQGDAARALEDIDDCLALEPHFAAAIVRKGSIMHRLLRYDDGIVVLEEGLNQFPTNPDLQNNLTNLKHAKHLHDTAETRRKNAMESLRRDAEIASERHEREMCDLRHENDMILEERDAETSLEIQKLRFYLEALEDNARMMNDVAAQKVDVGDISDIDWNGGGDPSSSSVAKGEIYKLRNLLENLIARTEDVKTRTEEINKKQVAEMERQLLNMGTMVDALHEENVQLSKSVSGLTFRLREEEVKVDKIKKILTWGGTQ